MLLTRCLLFCLVFISGAMVPSAAQYGPRLVYGIFIGSAAKFGPFQQPRMRYHAWGEMNSGLSVGISGAEPTSMTFRVNVQFKGDDIIIPLGPQREGYIIDSRSFLLNPEVCIPLRNRYGDPKVELLAGIGIDVLFDQALSQQNSTGNFGGSYLDVMNDSIRHARRDLVPFATAGLAFRLNRRGSLVFRIRQDAQNNFLKGSQITLPTTFGDRTVNLSCQATRVLIGCQITLGKLPEVF